MTSYTELNDAELIALLKTGDEKGFEEIFTRYESLLINFAYKKTGDKDEAKDILQDLFIHVWNNRSDLELKSSLSSYLYSSVLNKVRDIYKHQVVKDEHVQYLQPKATAGLICAGYIMIRFLVLYCPFM